MVEKENNQDEVLFGESAHNELLKGAEILAKAVRVTMGPSGHNVIIDSESGPIITKDGVTVARSIKLKNKLHSIGAQLLKEVAAKTNDITGDGTTTATVLAFAILRQGLKMMANGRSAIEIKRGIDKGVLEVVSFLKDHSIPVRNNDDIRHVGTISANGDKLIGDILAEAVEKVGRDGIITIEEAKSLNTSLEVVEGMRFDNGYISPYMITNPEKMCAELILPIVLLTNKKLNSLQEMIPVLELAAKYNRSVLIVAEEVEGEALQTLVVNKLKGTIKVCAVKAPGYGDHRDEMLSDMCALVGGRVISSTEGASLKNLVLADFGTKCKKVIVTRYTTTIIGDTNCEAQKQKIKEQVNSLKTLLETDLSMDDLQKTYIKKRLAKLSGGIAVIKVGGATEVEMKERKDRVEDALNATMAATQDGIIPGGGSALYHASIFLDKLLKGKIDNLSGLSEDEMAGVEVIISSCLEPMSQILKNAGKSPELIMDKLTDKVHHETDIKIYSTEKDKMLDAMRFGYDAYKHEICDLIERGIIDPTKVEICSIEHAASIVGLMLTSDCVIIDQSA